MTDLNRQISVDLNYVDVGNVKKSAQSYAIVLTVKITVLARLNRKIVRTKRVRRTLMKGKKRMMTRLMKGKKIMKKKKTMKRSWLKV